MKTLLVTISLVLALYLAVGICSLLRVPSADPTPAPKPSILESHIPGLGGSQQDPRPVLRN